MRYLTRARLGWGSLALAVIAFFGLAASNCSGTQSKAQSTSKNALAPEQLASANALATYDRTQLVPYFPWSQIRQNLIELETSQAQTTQTTSFFFNQGVQNPVFSCPSVGYPMSGTDQISNPQQKLIETSASGDHGNVTLPQIDPNGIYQGDTTGTYVLCVDATGKPYMNYWEGFVQAVSGPASWDATKHQVTLTGPSSFDYTVGKK